MLLKVKNGCKPRHQLLKILLVLILCALLCLLYLANGAAGPSSSAAVVMDEVPSRVSVNCARPVRWSGPAKVAYSVLFNYVPAEDTSWTAEEFNRSVTYVTHATFKYLNHLVNIADRWVGPISVAVYAPATDFLTALNVIAALRRCSSAAVRRAVTFHLFYDSHLSPSHLPCSFDDFIINSRAYSIIDCDRMWDGNISSYMVNNNMTYPVNVARNIARLSAQTRYVLVTDVELYPSADIGPMFVRMMNGSGGGDEEAEDGRSVYVLPLFEVERNYSAPLNKTQLLSMMKQKLVVPFHKFVCSYCHRVPRQEEWLKANGSRSPTLSVAFSTKRHKPFNNWEPVYIGSNRDPLYDGRLHWEGMSDKMTQAYEMCLLDYNFSVLDNAFMVHAPGIKRYSKVDSRWRHRYVIENNRLKRQIKKELEAKHKPNKLCTL